MVAANLNPDPIFPPQTSPSTNDALADCSEQPSPLIAAAQVARAALGSKRSDKLQRLFEFLLDRATEGRPPTEIEIAEAVFSRGRALDLPQDATVRVYMHRLRKALAQIYAEHPGRRLHIPRGEYRIVLAEEASLRQEDEHSTEESPTPGPPKTAPPWLAPVLALAVLAAANAAAWSILRPHPQDEVTPGLVRTALWRPIAKDDRPVTIVLGDYYLFSDSSNQAGDPTASPRLVRDPSINSRDDLDIYLMRYPGEIGRLADLNLNYVPSSVVAALGDVFTTVRGLKRDKVRHTQVIPASQLTPDMLKSSDVIYIGLLSGLGPLLRNPVFQASSFRVGVTYDELIDTASGRRFASDAGISAEEHVPRRDYGYVASLPGPSGNRLVILAGTRDPALLQMAELARDPAMLRAMSVPAAHSFEGFEALYQVRTMGNLNLGGKLLIERPLRSRGIWDTGKASQRFPNDTYEGAGHEEP